MTIAYEAEVFQNFNFPWRRHPLRTLPRAIRLWFRNAESRPWCELATFDRLSSRVRWPGTPEAWNSVAGAFADHMADAFDEWAKLPSHKPKVEPPPRVRFEEMKGFLREGKTRDRRGGFSWSVERLFYCYMLLWARQPKTNRVVTRKGAVEFQRQEVAALKGWTKRRVMLLIANAFRDVIEAARKHYPKLDLPKTPEAETLRVQITQKERIHWPGAGQSEIFPVDTNLAPG